MNNDNSEEGSDGNSLRRTQKTNKPEWPPRNFVGTYRAEGENCNQIPPGELRGRDGYGSCEAGRCNKP